MKMLLDVQPCIVHIQHSWVTYRSLNPNMLPNIIDYKVGSPSITVTNDQVTTDLSTPAIQQESSCAGADKSQCKLKYTSKSTNKYNLHTWKSMTSNKYFMLAYISQIIDANLLYY